jgi:hypothetical protein
LSWTISESSSGFHHRPSAVRAIRRDAEEFFSLAHRVPARKTVQTFPLSEENEAFDRLRAGHISGAAVPVPGVVTPTRPVHTGGKPQPAVVTATAAGRHCSLKELNMSDWNLFVGTWKLVSWEVTQPDRTIYYLYSKKAVGYLIYTADGYMSAEIIGSGNQKLTWERAVKHA